MEITQEMLSDALSGAADQLKQNLIKEMQSGITWDIKSAIQEDIRNHISDWCKDNIIPEITAELIHGKKNIVDAICKDSHKSVGSLIAKAMRESLEKKMENSWTRTKVLEALFKD